MTPEEKKTLLAYARKALEEHLGLDSADHRAPLNIQTAPPGLFVTIYHRDEVRGSMGNIILHEPLPQAIVRLTQEAAFKDAKSPPLTAEEYPDIRLEISLLSPLKRVFHIEDIEPELHGVYIHKGRQIGVLLPQVWKELPNRTDFLNALCRQKAGLPRGGWMDPEVEMYVFTVEIVAEERKA